MRTLKEELICLREWSSHYEVEKALQKWIKEYNQSYLQSAHGYRSPAWAENNYRREKVA